MEDQLQSMLDEETIHGVEIDSRACSSDDFDGVEYTIEAEYVPIRPVLDLIRETDGKAIEFIGHVDADYTALLVFIVDADEEVFV